MKALIPAAGRGTRCLPLTRAIPRELMPWGRFPFIHHVVAEAKAAGFTEIGIILSSEKMAIRDYFTRDDALMAALEASGRTSLMADWEALMDGLSLTWIEQPEPRGLGHAVACGEAFARGKAVGVLLGDTLIEGESPLPGLLKEARAHKRSQVAVEPVPAERARKTGVCGGVFRDSGLYDLTAIVEEPEMGEVPKMEGAFGTVLPDAFAVAGRFLLSPGIFKALADLEPGRHGELHLIDALATLLGTEGVGAVRLLGKRRVAGE